MRGHIVKRSENSYSIVLNLGREPDTGKRRQQWVTVKGGKRDAEKRLAELLHQLDTGTFIKLGKLTVADYLEQWLRDTAYPNLTPRTYEGYEFMVRKHIKPALGMIPLVELKPQHLQHLYSEKLSSGKGYRTAQYIHNTLNKALSVAVKMGILARNPCEGVESPKVPRHEMQTMSESDIHIFLELARSGQYYHLFYVALFTGMRRSELLVLRWCDIDLELCQISVNRTMHVLRYGTYKGQIVFKQPKTAKSRRLIALSPSTASVLREHKEAQAKLRQSLGLPFNDADFVFCQYNGEPLLPDTISHAWLKLARHAGLKGIRLHDARHSHASLMLKQGIHPKIVQERLGHVSIETTLDTYSHVVPGLQQAAANRFDDIVLLKQKDAIIKSIG